MEQPSDNVSIHTCKTQRPLTRCTPIVTWMSSDDPKAFRMSHRVRGTRGTPKDLRCRRRLGRTQWRVPWARNWCRVPRQRGLRQPPLVGCFGFWLAALSACVEGACCVAPPPPPSHCAHLPPRRGGRLSGIAQMCRHLLRCLPVAEPHQLLPPSLHGPDHLPRSHRLWVRYAHRWA